MAPAIIIVVILGAVVLVLLSRVMKNAADTDRHAAAMKSGKGVFLTFNYSPEEWEYFTRNLVLSGKQGQVFFGEKLIYMADGTEDLIIELFDSDPRGRRLREVKIEEEFIVFSIILRDVWRQNIAGQPYFVRSDTEAFEIFIPGSQREDANRLLGYYQRLITRNNDRRSEQLAAGAGQ
jgi:hypothetical protein